jgi:G3E family GTPase
LALDGVVTVVDADQFPQPSAEHYWLARDQLALADVIVVNKTDLIGSAERRRLTARLREYVPHGRLLEAREGAAPPELVLGELRHASDRREGVSRDGAASTRDAPHAASLESFVYRSERPMDLVRLRDACTSLPEAVFRVKGTVHLRQRPRHATRLQVVGRRARIDIGEPWGEHRPATALVCIGTKAGWNEALLRKRLEHCEAARPAAWWQRLGWFARRKRAPATGLDV